MPGKWCRGVVVNDRGGVVGSTRVSIETLASWLLRCRPNVNISRTPPQYQVQGDNQLVGHYYSRELPMLLLPLLLFAWIFRRFTAVTPKMKITSRQTTDSEAACLMCPWSDRKRTTLWVKKQDTKLLPITSLNINRFSNFFHWRTR